ncbi:MAG TPA: 4-hydroxybenzoate octaprenyltransferase [Alphaproteobacteria bacterium]|nr:4-hydroxybenzoate octaprenyltransferase [Alphaproteobacteria bacterium]
MTGLATIWNDFWNGQWLDRHCPAALKPYARLMRLDKPIGTWLLLLPCWWSIALASDRFPNIGLIILFALGAIVMRGAGCVVNDIYDRKLDHEVARTSTRPLASGELKLWQAIIFLAMLLLIGLGVLIMLNGATITIGVVSLLLVFTYPLMKRITWWPQLFLGFTFNWGALMGWSAVTGGIGLGALWLYIAGIFWTLGYDTIYAHQDVHDDARIGVKSTARLFGADSKHWVAGFYAFAVLFLALAGHAVQLKESFYVLLILAAGFAAVQIMAWKMNDPNDCRWRFEGNRNFGLIVLAGIILGKYI